MYADSQYLFQVQVFLDDIDPESLRVELYAEEKKDAGAVTLTMNRGEGLVGAQSLHIHCCCQGHSPGSGLHSAPHSAARGRTGAAGVAFYSVA